MVFSLLRIRSISIVVLVFAEFSDKGESIVRQILSYLKGKELHLSSHITTVVASDTVGLFGTGAI